MKTLAGLLAIIVIGAAGCAHSAPRLYAPMQPDGWSAQPISITWRFAPDADLDPATGTPVGDEGYYLYILTQAADWDHSTVKSFLLSLARRPWGHCWLILESPENRLECGHNGNFGKLKPDYAAGVNRKYKDGDPNPISYLWETMSDGVCEMGNPNRRTPTFVWRMPITKRRYELIYEYLMQRKYDQIGVRANNCVDMVTDAAKLAGINFVHRMRLTWPAEKKILGQTVRVWTNPEYRILEFSTPGVLEVDLRYLAQFGIGSEATDWYLAWKR
jgi:hypothetical protein